jgi:hypothetical protein
MEENMQFDTKNLTTEYAHLLAAQVDWNMQDLVWNNLPWDWDLVDGLLVDGIGEGAARDRGHVQDNKGQE